MENKINNDISNIFRMKDIANIYHLTEQKEKAEKYHKTIIKICEKYPSNENMLLLKISSQNYLKTSYKSLETTKRLLKLNPYNIYALFNIAKYLNKFPT